MLDYQGKGFGIAECSHRGKEFDGVTDEAIARCKSLLGIGDSHDVLFMQGGATQLFTLIPMNFLHGSADYLVSGEWSKKAASFGKEVGKLNIVATSEASNAAAGSLSALSQNMGLLVGVRARHVKGKP